MTHKKKPIFITKQFRSETGKSITKHGLKIPVDVADYDETPQAV